MLRERKPTTKTSLFAHSLERNDLIYNILIQTITMKTQKKYQIL